MPLVIAVDYDGTLTQLGGDPLVAQPWLPGAIDGLLALKRAGHTLILWSARANRALLLDPQNDALVRAGKRAVDQPRWAAAVPTHSARLQAMIRRVRIELPGVFDAIDLGHAGKPDVDLFIDDKAWGADFSLPAAERTWAHIARVHGA